jgi:hypothetical protein
MPKVTQAKRKLKAGGWTYRSAAPVLGTSTVWLNKVLNGHAVSSPLLTAIDALPTFDEWRKAHEQPTEA